MSGSVASPFGILHDWTNNMLADAHRGFGSIAIRLSKIAGESTNYVLIWGKTSHGGVESGCFVSMIHGDDVQSTSNISELVNLLKSLPKSARKEIAKSLS